MSAAEKVARVQSTQAEHGLNRSLAALDLPKSTWYYYQKDKVDPEEKYVHLRPVLEEIACEHPEYGYRRTRVELLESYGIHHNHKLVQKLHQLWGLPLLRSTHAPPPSGIRQAIEAAGDRINLVAGREQIGLFEVVYTDFTELRYAAGAYKAYLMPIIGHGARAVLGWAVGLSANTDLALNAWDCLKQTLHTWQLDLPGLVVHHDQDPVYTGYRWTGQLLIQDKARVSYALNGARDNPYIEAFFSRFKTENRSLFLDAQSLDELRRIVAERIAYYNTVRRHSSIGYRAPLDLVREHLNGTWRPQILHC